jgi:hypothetical protein
MPLRTLGMNLCICVNSMRVPLQAVAYYYMISHLIAFISHSDESLHNDPSQY